MHFIHLNQKIMQGKKTKIVDFISKLFGVKSKSKIEVTILRVGSNNIVALFSINGISQELLKESLVSMVEEYSLNLLNEK